MSHLGFLLQSFRDAAHTPREQGTYFERLAVDFIKNDPGMAQEYEDAWLFSDWANAHGHDGRDTGIDAVAKLRDGGGWCAIQCKFYDSRHRIQKPDVDSFFSTSGKTPFTRRLFIDTTEGPWSENAEALLEGQQIATSRIGLDRLERSLIDWTKYFSENKLVVAQKKQLREHQAQALMAVRNGFATSDRGKLLMACGTGKTFTALKIAETLAGAGKSVLFLVPSLSLMSQSIREWTIDSETPLRAFAVCSDTQVGKRRSNDADIAELEAHDLDYPATTDAAKVAAKMRGSSAGRMTVVFATYQSVQVISVAQKQHKLSEFDLIVCDEAHRTTGVVGIGDESQDSNFVKVHNQAFLQGKKRLYMTATPRIFGEAVKTKAGEESVELCSMDDPAIYGETLFERGFGWAVENGLLTDYKVIVLAVDEGMVSAGLQQRLADGDNELKLDDATKIIGCYKALTKSDLKTDVGGDFLPMRRGLAFCRDIASSKLIQKQFAATVDDFLESDEGRGASEGNVLLSCELEHVDGTFRAKERTRLLDWLKENQSNEVCRILTNARCLSEGVDVPALDAILFMHPRKSQIDVVQSVGRVMRRAEGKQMGYVILPIGIPAGMSAEDALNDNDRYRVVWQILNALRSHDERLDATINKIDLGEDVSSKIEVVAVTDKLPVRKSQPPTPSIGHGSAPGDEVGQSVTPSLINPLQGSLVFDEVSRAIMARIVKKCGKRDYWESWANDIASIARTHITRITTIVIKSGSPEREAFDAFLLEIRSNLNDSVTEADAIEMLAQHVITRPVFDALFENSSFALNNPVSIAMEAVLAKLDEHSLEKEATSLQKFYASVRRRAAGIESAGAKQRVVAELYEKFFRTAFPRTTERLGIVYTPIEIVDFLLHSVNDVLQEEFGKTLSSEGVHIIEPFVGTGTFITRLLQSGLIKQDDLRRKYMNEIHGNEIVLLAYYIAAINIETTYASLMDGHYDPFSGICLADTFRSYEPNDLISSLLAQNSERMSRQRKLPIQVVIGNPPYSVGQKSENDNAANVAYPAIDGRVRETYAARSERKLKGLYNSYVRAIRWGSDRLQGAGGVIAYVTDAGWIERGAMDGLRRCLADEFSSIYVFNLRGDARTQGELRKRERDNVFGQGSRQPIAMVVLVKNAHSGAIGKIRYREVGDYLSRQQKLDEVARRISVRAMEEASSWTVLSPNEHGDWIKQRDNTFSRFLAFGDKAGGEPKLFENFSMGVVTARDAWCVNSSRSTLLRNIESLLGTYHAELARFSLVAPSFNDAEIRERYVDDFVLQDTKRISWSQDLKRMLGRQRRIDLVLKHAMLGCHRPFQRQWMYFDSYLNWSRYQLPRLFPSVECHNRIISVTGLGASAPFSALMLDTIPNNKTVDNCQNYPLYTYAAAPPEHILRASEADAELFDRFDAITDEGLRYFQTGYVCKKITKDDIFYYTYGILHSKDYRSRYIDTLSKQLPRLPLVKEIEHFWAFVKAGRDLGDLHVRFEGQECWQGVTALVVPDLALKVDQTALYRIEQMKFAGKRPNADKTTIIYNSKVKITGVPLEAYDYVVNGRSAIEWVMERQCVSTDKASGIVNDANDYANETMHDPEYPLKLLLSVITVSMKTLEIVRSLPALDIMPSSEAEVIEPLGEPILS